MRSTFSQLPSNESRDRVSTLAAIAAQGGERAFTELLHACRPMIVNHLARIGFRSTIIASEDLEQIANLAVHEALGRWRPSRAGFSSFASRVVRCRLLSAIRRRQPVTESLNDEETSSFQLMHRRRFTAEHNLELQEEANAILRTMPVRERTMIRRLSEGWTYVEIGTVFGLSAPQVDNIIQRVRRGHRRNATRSKMELTCV